MRLVILTATLASLALAPAAQAATRYADPAGGSTQPCSADAPCSLKGAVQVAQTGDDVAVAPGDYAVTTGLSPRSGVSLHGVAGLPRPRLLGSSQLAGVLLTLDQGATATRLDVEAGSHSEAALSVRQATVSDLVVISRGANLGLYVQPDRAGTVLTNSVVRCNGCDTGAVVFKGGDNAGNAAAVNVTAIAAGGPAIALSSPAALSLVNVAAAGSSADIAANDVHASIQTSFSAFRPGASSGVVDGGGNVAAAPLFADDFGRPAPGSPTIDAGTADPRAGATDVDGSPRPTGAATDIGAFEAVPPAPASDAAPGGSGQSSPFTATLGPVSPAGGLDDDGSLAPVGKAVAGRSFAIGTASGTVLARAPGGRFARVDDGAQLPLGAEIDARAGTVRLTSAADAKGTPQTALFTGSRFRVRQTKGAKPVTQLQLTGGSFGSCGARARAAKTGAVRSLWGRDKGGRFQTRGRGAAATVRGTHWLTEDTCQGTRVTVKEGAVQVHDDAKRRNVLVRAGHSYLARVKP